MEDEFSPIVIMATNRGISRIRGTEYKSPHGMPMDLLDRSITIHTSSYSADEIRTILSIRANEEEVELSGDALALLTKIGQETSLRYAANLISVSQQISLKKKNKNVDLQDIKRAYMLFLDADRSVQYLEENSSQYIDDSGNVTIGKEQSTTVEDDKMETD